MSKNSTAIDLIEAAILADQNNKNDFDRANAVINTCYCLGAITDQEKHDYKKQIFELQCKKHKEEIDKNYNQSKLNIIQQWISVKDKLPEIDTPVAILTDHIYMLPDVAYRSKTLTGNPWCSRYTLRVDNIIYWMPLPKPPKE